MLGLSAGLISRPRLIRGDNRPPQGNPYTGVRFSIARVQPTPTLPAASRTDLGDGQRRPPAATVAYSTGRWRHRARIRCMHGMWTELEETIRSRHWNIEPAHRAADAAQQQPIHVLVAAANIRKISTALGWAFGDIARSDDWVVVQAWGSLDRTRNEPREWAGPTREAPRRAHWMALPWRKSGRARLRPSAIRPLTGARSMTTRSTTKSWVIMSMRTGQLYRWHGPLQQGP
jgi:hypothetical protein